MAPTFSPPPSTHTSNRTGPSRNIASTAWLPDRVKSKRSGTCCATSWRDGCVKAGPVSNVQPPWLRGLSRSHFSGEQTLSSLVFPTRQCQHPRQASRVAPLRSSCFLATASSREMHFPRPSSPSRKQVRQTAQGIAAAQSLSTPFFLQY